MILLQLIEIISELVKINSNRFSSIVTITHVHKQFTEIDTTEEVYMLTHLIGSIHKNTRFSMILF